MYFTDPDGDDLGYDFSGDNITDVALAHLEDGTLSIDPVSGGEVSFYVVATDAGGLSAVTSVSVSVTEPAGTHSSTGGWYRTPLRRGRCDADRT